MQSVDVVVQVLRRLVRRPSGATGDLDLNGNLSLDHGLTSLDKVLLMTSVCDECGVALTAFTEDEIGKLSTPMDIVDALNARLEGGT